MKKTLCLIIAVAVISSVSYLFFLSKSATDKTVDSSVNRSAINKAADKEINTSFESETENQSSPPTHSDVSDSMQIFDYGECYSFDQEYAEKLAEKQDIYVDTLKNSAIKDDKIAYTIFNNMTYPKPSEVKEVGQLKLDALLDLDLIEEPLIAQEILHTCTVLSQYELCDNDLIESLTSQHKNDSELWLRATDYYLKTEQDDLVFNAIEQVKQSKYSSFYSYLFITAYTNAMEKAGIGSYNSNVTRALLYYNTTRLPSHNKTSEWCRGNLDKDKYTQGCLDLATMLEQKSHDLLSKQMGIALQSYVYRAEGNTELLEILEQRSNKLQPKYLSDESKKLLDVSKTVFQYEKLLRVYITNTAILGETGAFAPLEDEVMAFRASDQYVDCGGI
jgi:hypothetical protein